jgi:uridine phosphorylase
VVLSTTHTWYLNNNFEEATIIKMASAYGFKAVNLFWVKGNQNMDDCQSTRRKRPTNEVLVGLDNIT